MAEAAVESLLQNLKQLMLYHVDLIKDIKGPIEKLENDLHHLRAFLKDTTKQRRKDNTQLHEVVGQIHDVVYDAEDAIDTFVTEAATSKPKLRFLKPSKSPVKLLQIFKEFERLNVTVQEVYRNQRLDFRSYSAIDEPKEMPHVREDNVVGFEEDERILMTSLNEETEQLDVITIVGMSGLGKTTLAWKIFRNREILFEFPIRIWVHVSEEFKMKDVLFSILKHFTHHSDHFYDKSEPELAQLVVSYLEDVKFLIVMDDVWTIDDWNKLQLALPKSNRMGKVLMTSCKEDVGRFANYSREPYKLRFLSPEESWEMLQLEVFGKRDVCPPEFRVLGKLIAEQCGGLPVAVKVMGGIIAKEYFQHTTLRAKMDAWREASKNVHIYLNSRFYNELPIHLRACFLYFGMFPGDYEIPAWKLICMWIAEGFVQAREGMSSEDTAHDYLEDLVNRSLVMVEKRKADGRIKTCRIHGTLRDFCISEAGKDKENFLHEIRQSRDASSEPRVLKYRRLCIHSNVLDFLSSKPDGPKVRSLVTFSKDEVNLPPAFSADIPSAFKLLRVLDVEQIRFTKISADMFRLFHLRYLVLSFNINVLPAALAKLWNLQTLVVKTACPTLEIRADIWQLTQLRHLKTNASATLPRIGKSSKEGEQLQTLGTISPECCTEQFLKRARSLKKLGIRGRLSSLLGKTEFLDGFGILSNLQKLKLLNDVFPSPPSEDILRGLPPPYKFPPKLRSLTLSHTCLNWEEMSILGMLDNLEVLKLKYKAFMGLEWVVADGGFRNLEFLHIEGTDLVVWETSGHHFPRLHRLQLRNCEKLREVPIGLADVPNLQHLDLYDTKLAAASAKKIHEVRNHKAQEELNMKFGAFKLSIYPPSE